MKFFQVQDPIIHSAVSNGIHKKGIRHQFIVSVTKKDADNWLPPGNNHISAISSISESTQTSQADLWYVKRCSCVVFSLKAQRKSSPHPIPPSLHISFIQIQHFFSREEQWGGGGGCGGVGGGVGGEGVVGTKNFRPVCQVFSPCFYGKTTQEHLFTSHKSACKVWVDSDILENFTQNGTNVIVARSLSIVQDFQ